MRLKIRCLVIGEYHCETLFEHQKCTLRRMKSKWFVQFKKNRYKLTSGFLYPFIPILYDIEKTNKQKTTTEIKNTSVVDILIYLARSIRNLYD